MARNREHKDKKKRTMSKYEDRHQLKKEGRYLRAEIASTNLWLTHYRKICTRDTIKNVHNYEEALADLTSQLKHIDKLLQVFK